MSFEIKKNLTISHIYSDFISISIFKGPDKLINLKELGLHLTGILDNLYEPQKIIERIVYLNDIESSTT